MSANTLLQMQCELHFNIIELSGGCRPKQRISQGEVNNACISTRWPYLSSFRWWFPRELGAKFDASVSCKCNRHHTSISGHRIP